MARAFMNHEFAFFVCCGRILGKIFPLFTGRQEHSLLSLLQGDLSTRCEIRQAGISQQYTFQFAQQLFKEKKKKGNDMAASSLYS